MSKPNKFCQDKEWLYDQYITQGKSTGQIANEINCGSSAVQRWLRYHEIPIRDCSTSKMKPSSQLLANEEWLRNEYLVQMKSATKIGEELNCQQETVSNYLHKYNILIRTQSEEISGERHPLYGKHHTNETKKLLSEKFTGKESPLTEEQRKEFSERFSGSGNPRFGVKLSKEQIYQQKCSLAKFYNDNDNYVKQKERILRGEDHPNWKGGISFEPYCPKFNNDLKERVRAFFDYTCITCGKSTEENNGQLAVHHVEYDKQACCHGKPIHFAAMCHRCHSITNFHRDEWEIMLHRIIDEIYDGRSYYTKEEYENLKKKPIKLRKVKDNYVNK
jgi:transposase